MGQLKENPEPSDSATAVPEGNCVVVHTISKFSYLLHIVLLPYDGPLSVG